MIYCDTSVLLKLYIREIDSDEWVEKIEKKKMSIGISYLNKIELTNAITLAEYRSQKAIKAKDILKRYDEDIATGVFDLIHVDEKDLIKECNKISIQKTVIHGLRTLDLMHLGVARISDSKIFFTADKLQKKVANDLGLHVG